MKKHGPVTQQGKAISSRNATKHGCCSTETLILPTETMDDFKALEQIWFRSYEPQDAAETLLIHQLVEANWFLQRATRALAQVEAQLFAATPNPLEWDDPQHKSLARFLRYQTTRTNTAAKHRKAFEDYRKNRASETTRIQVAQHKDEKLVIAQARLKTYQERNKPDLSWDEHMDALRQKAIRLGHLPPDVPLR